MLKEIGNISQVIKEANEMSRTLFGFVIAGTVVMAAMIILIMAFSTMPFVFNAIIVGTLMLAFLVTFFFVLFKSINNPQRFIFNQNAFITLRREKLGDADQNSHYFSDTRLDENTEAPMELSSPGKSENK